MDTIQSINQITTNPSVRNGKPCLAGTGIKVTDIVIAHLFHQRTLSEIASDFNLSLAPVYAALAFYYEHKLALDEDIRQQISTARAAREQRLGSSKTFTTLASG